MRDIDLRRTLLASLVKQHEDDPSTRIVQEMGIWAGTVRIDVAVINGELQGYELKSDRDTLERLPSQASIYSQVFDRVHLVVGQKHARKALNIVPKWWGLTSAEMSNNEVSLLEIRPSLLNPCYDIKQITRLLWKEEAIDILIKHDAIKGFRSKSIDVIQDHIIRTLDPHMVRAEIRSALKKRQSWLR